LEKKILKNKKETMEIVCKVLKNGKVYFKCDDTFWSLSSDVKDAKTHTLESFRLDGSLIRNYLYVINKYSENKSEYNGVKIGYDQVLEMEKYTILKTKPGEWIYRLKYLEETDEIVVVDASRLAKLKELEKSY